jgi:4-diphosphocytidyl-2-C-methyl-D-erythritol kinase
LTSTTSQHENKPTLTWPAPAKLNLFLHITRQREDGYHELQTLFQFLDYGDSLQFAIRDDGEIKRSTSIEAVTQSSDLTLRAAKSLQDFSKCSLGVEIEMKKRLPIGAGLGGGSSDAATTLIALNELWNLRISMEELAEIGLKLGADVPVFIRGFCAWAEGIGEQLTPVDLPETWYLVITPSVTVPTAALFAASELTRDARPITIRDYFAGAAINVFQDVVKQRYPEVGQVLDWVAAQGLAGQMTGTGSSIFAALSDEAAAQKIKRRVPQQWRVFIAKGINESPLITQWKLLHGG